jgi:hypothetical protein
MKLFVFPQFVFGVSSCWVYFTGVSLGAGAGGFGFPISERCLWHRHCCKARGVLAAELCRVFWGMALSSGHAFGGAFSADWLHATPSVVIVQV